MARIFTDDFETGDFSKWSDSSNNDGGDLSIASGAALHGVQGMNILANDNVAKYAIDASPNSNKRYRFRFYFDLNSITMADYDQVRIFEAKSGAFQAIIITMEWRFGIGYRIIATAILDSGSGSVMTQYVITDAPHYIEIDWKASSGAGANDGTMELLIDGVSKQTLTGIDSDAKAITDAWLGFTNGNNTGTRGTVFYDDFDSNDNGDAIGAYVAPVTLPMGGKTLLGAGA